MLGSELDVFVVGAGRAGLVMTRALLRTRHRILGTWNRTAEAAAGVRKHTGAPAFHGRIPQVARSANLILVAVRDDLLSEMDARLARDGVVGPNMVVAHLAGALDSTVLRACKEAGAAVGSMHPVASFSEESQLPVGTHFAVEGEPAAVEMLRQLVDDLGGTPLTVDPGQKPRYHSALVFASNYLVALASIAQHILERSGIREEDARAMLGPLLEGTARNIRREGATDALTGPVTRGDVETVRSHLKALSDEPDLENLYRALGVRAVAVAERQGLDPAAAEALLKLLKSPRR
ncbi:MAG: Rossmann-like and DUF2520 domain-containing protein [Myxococcota bacterium]